MRIVVKRGYQYIAEVANPEDPPRSNMLEISSIAILPFKDRSQDKSFQWLADGLANELTTRLQGVNNLEVPVWLLYPASRFRRVPEWGRPRGWQYHLRV